MYSIWTEHLKSAEEKEKFKEYIVRSKPLLDRLKDIMDDKERSLDRSENTLKAYESPSWAYKQAHLNGYRASLEAIRKLITLDQGELSEHSIRG